MGSARAAKRLGWGDWDLPGGAKVRAEARMHFLSAIVQYAPEVLQDLAEDPLACYQEQAKAAEPEDLGSWQSLSTAAADWAPNLCPLRDAIDAWAARHALDAEWCRDRALHTLAFWSGVPDDSPLRENWSFEAVAYFKPIGAEERAFTFTHPGWDPSFGSRAEAARAIRAAFNQYLSAYLAAMDVLAGERDMTQAPEKRSLDHFVWLVHYQIHGMSFERLAREVYVSRQTATNGVKHAAVLIGLPLRPPGRPGRPRKHRP